MIREFSVRLRQERKKRGFTQDKVANFIGVARCTLSQYESGMREPPLIILASLSTLFDVTAGYLIGLEPQKGENVIREYEVTGTATVEIEYKTWLYGEDGEDFSDQVEALIEGGELEPLKITVTEPGVKDWRKIS